MVPAGIHALEQELTGSIREPAVAAISPAIQGIEIDMGSLQRLICSGADHRASDRARRGLFCSLWGRILRERLLGRKHCRQKNGTSDQRHRTQHGGLPVAAH
jgi:hypothetical protein